MRLVKFSMSANTVNRALLDSGSGSSWLMCKSIFVIQFDVKPLRGAIMPRYLASPVELIKVSNCCAIVAFEYDTSGSFTPVGT